MKLLSLSGAAAGFIAGVPQGGLPLCGTNQTELICCNEYYSFDITSRVAASVFATKEMRQVGTRFSECVFHETKFIDTLDDLKLPVSSGEPTHLLEYEADWENMKFKALFTDLPVSYNSTVISRMKELYRSCMNSEVINGPGTPSSNNSKIGYGLLVGMSVVGAGLLALSTFTCCYSLKHRLHMNGEVTALLEKYKEMTPV